MHQNFNFYRANIVALGMLLFFMTIKGGGQYVIADGIDLFEISLNYLPIVSTIKSMSLELASIAFLALFWLLPKVRDRFSPVQAGPTFYITALSLYFIRVAFDIPEESLNIAIALCFNIGFYFYCKYTTSTAKPYGQEENYLMMGVLF